MGYSNNRNNVSLTTATNLYSDGCGNLYEEKYYVNGAYIDLCGLPIEEYMKNPYCCGGSDSDEDIVKTKNDILIKTTEDENGIFYFQAISKFPSASNIKITIKLSNNTVTELDLYAGQTETQKENGDVKDILSVSLDINEDDFYSYIVVTEEDKTIFDVYIGAIHLSESEGFSDELSQFSMGVGTTSDIVYTIPKTDVNYNEMEDIEEFEEFCNNNQYCFVLCLPKKIYDDKKYTIFNYGGSDITYKFEYVNTFVKTNEEYVYLRESSKDDIMPYVPLYGEDIVYEYKLTLNN